MVISRRSVLCLAALGTTALLSATSAARAAAKVRIGVLKFGTVSWELDTLKHHKFDAANGIDLEVVYFAGEDATNVAMLAGEIDIIVSDWLWVSRLRSEGDDVTLAPYSTAVGAIMVKEDSPDPDDPGPQGQKDSASPAARSTRAGCSSRRWPSAITASTLRRAAKSFLAHRRWSRKRRCRANSMRC